MTWGILCNDYNTIKVNFSVNPARMILIGPCINISDAIWIVQEVFPYVSGGPSSFTLTIKDSDTFKDELLGVVEVITYIDIFLPMIKWLKYRREHFNIWHKNSKCNFLCPSVRLLVGWFVCPSVGPSKFPTRDTTGSHYLRSQVDISDILAGGVLREHWLALGQVNRGRVQLSVSFSGVQV